MRCRYCEHTEFDYSENHELCALFGYGDDGTITEDAKGEMGCRYTKKSIDKMLKISVEEDCKAFAEECGSFNEFMEKELKKAKDLYEDEFKNDYKSNYYQNAKDEYAEYKVVKVQDIFVSGRKGDRIYNKQILLNKEELEEMAFEEFEKDYMAGKIKDCE